MGDDNWIRFEATIEEALSLLDLVLLTPVDLSSAQQQAVHKLADFCRESLRQSPDPEAIERKLLAAEMRASRPATGELDLELTSPDTDI